MRTVYTGMCFRIPSNYMAFKESKVDPCMYWKWTKQGYLIVWLFWLDDSACLGGSEDVKREVETMKE